MKINIILVVSLAAVAALALVVGGWVLLRYLSYRNGVLGKKRVDAALKKFGVIRRYKVLRDVHLKVGNREAQIDHLLIGFFGMLFVSTVNDTAEYYGGVKDPEWTKVTPKGERSKMENLLERNLRSMDVVREIFAKKKIFNIRMEGVVVFCGRPKKTLIGIPKATGLMPFKSFKAYITKAKFEKDHDVDVPQLASAIEEYRV